MITKTVIQSSSSEDIIKMSSAFLPTTDAIRMPQLNSLWAFNPSIGIILYRIRVGLHNVNAAEVQTPQFLY